MQSTVEASDGASSLAHQLGDATFRALQHMLLQASGIHLSDAKKAMVAGRLAKRVRHHGLQGFDAYQRLLGTHEEERRIAIELLTTNETHFFREPPHFDFLRDLVIPSLPANRCSRFWSAAASSGQEAYSLAMLLARHGDGPWEVFGSDINTQVLQQAQAGVYPLQQANQIPPDYLKDYCLRGVGGQSGKFSISPALRDRVRFAPLNLSATLPDIGQFDVILLRNVLIYFQPDMKRQVLRRVLGPLRPGGWLMVGHSESFGCLIDGVETLAPSVYRKR